MKSLSLKSFRKLLSSVWLLGVILALPIILSLPELFSKYKMIQIMQEPAPQPNDYRIYFRDLDRNGIKQKIYAFRNKGGQLAVQYFGDNGGLINEIVFRHQYSRNIPYVYFGDVNRNGINEIYGFTLKGDSLFLNKAELVHIHTKSTESLFISRIGTYDNGKFDFSVSRFFILDMDNDGNLEIIMSIISGHSKFPRMLVIYHPDTGRMLKSKDETVNPFYVIYYDINDDQKPEILACSNAGYNLNDSTDNVILDDRSYLHVYDSGLNFLFPPVPLSVGINNNIQIFVNDPNKDELVVFQFNQSLSRDKMIRIFKIGFDGQLRDSVILPEFGKRFRFQVFPEYDYYWLFTGDKMVMLDMEINVVETKNINVSSQMFRNPEGKAGFPEMASLDLLLQTITVYTENFNRKVEMDYEIEKIRGVYLDIGKGPDHFMVQTNMNEYTYRFQKNWLYYLKFPAYLIIYFFSVLFIWLIQNIREKQLHEKFELKNQLKEMEIKYLRMQMDPHFMFNAFTTMALMIKNGDRTEAFDSFMKFTRMLRSNFDFSNHLTRPLSEELQTVKDYLEINKLRFKERLNYEVSVTDDVPVNALIPKMIIQIHVENSLKHGLSQQEKPGVIRIDVVKDGDYLGLSVQDNGIGRKKAATLDRPSTKQGIKMLQALIDRLNAQNKLNITQGYTDLQDDSGNPAGTRVDIKVPLSLKEMVES